MAEKQIFVKVPEGEDVHVVLCRAESAARADHEILPSWQVRGLQEFMDLYVLRTIRAQCEEVVSCDWSQPNDWKKFLGFQEAEVVANFDDNSKGKNILVAIRRKGTGIEMVTNVRMLGPSIHCGDAG